MNVLVLGAGQLARMMALSVKPLNISIRAFDTTVNQVVDPLATEQSLGDLTQGIAFADVITAEFEHVAHDVLAQCEASGKLYPCAQAIKIGGDRRLEKQLLLKANIANAPHVVVDSQESYDGLTKHLSFPIILKSALEGYDGKGQWRIKTPEQATELWPDIQQFLADNPKQGIVAEQMIAFDREISLVGVRSAQGEIQTYTLTENHHSNGILSVSLANGDHGSFQQQAQEIFTRLTDSMNYVGTLAIEFFQVGQQLLVNEIAPRVHNSGHWTQQGAETCQFANHIRAVCQLPIGSTQLIRPTAMINIIGEDTLATEVLNIPGVTLHWYGKTKRAGRKMGHINVCASSNQLLKERLSAVATHLPATAFADVKDYIHQLG